MSYLDELMSEPMTESGKLGTSTGGAGFWESALESVGDLAGEYMAFRMDKLRQEAGFYQPEILQPQPVSSGSAFGLNLSGTGSIAAIALIGVGLVWAASELID